MSGLYLIQVTICIFFMESLVGQPLYEEECRVDEMYQRFKEAYNRDVLLQTQVDNLKNQLDSIRVSEKVEFRRRCLSESGTYKERSVTNTQYCFIKSSLTWNEGKRKCLSINSYLLEINSDAEQSWLMDEKTSGNNWWTGGIEDTNGNVWVWEHSGDKLVFKNWDPAGNQPSGGTAENCLGTYKGLWHDFPCKSSFYIICEK